MKTQNASRLAAVEMRALMRACAFLWRRTGEREQLRAALGYRDVALFHERCFTREAS